VQLQEIHAKVRTGKSWILVLVCAAISLACVAIPMFVLRPFRLQSAQELSFALTVWDVAPWLAGLCAAMALLLAVQLWKTAQTRSRIILACLGILTTSDALLTHVNLFERMFSPYPSPAVVNADAVKMDLDDRVLAVKVGWQARAYPIRAIAYHRIVNDTVSGVPVAATYCMLSHTGIVWSPVMDGKTLHFHVAGFNNENALLRDEETRSVWQQSTGEAIFGPLKGRQLEPLPSNELSFALWRREQPNGQILKPATPYESDYEPKNWESSIAATRAVIDTTESGIAPHQLMVGVTEEGLSTAYPIEAILSTKLIQDQVEGLPLVVVVGPDKTSIRAFEAIGNRGTKLTFANDQGESVMRDTQTGSSWNFKGCAVKGLLIGQCLKEIDVHKDYWFDWMNHHPSSPLSSYALSQMAWRSFFSHFVWR
jgi:hypothetical protein